MIDINDPGMKQAFKLTEEGVAAMSETPEVDNYLIKRARTLYAEDKNANITYPSSVAARQVREFIRELAGAYERAVILLDATQKVYVRERAAVAPQPESAARWPGYDPSKPSPFDAEANAKAAAPKEKDERFVKLAEQLTDPRISLEYQDGKGRPLTTEEQAMICMALNAFAASATQRSERAVRLSTRDQRK